MFVALFLLVAGCARYHPQPLSPEQTAAQLESRRLDDPGLKPFLEKNLGHALSDWPLEKWDLNTLTLAAFYFHPDLDVARAQWRVAEAGIKTAGARPNPSLTVTPAYDSQIPDNPSPWMVPMSLDVPIETAGKRAKRIAEARDVSQSAWWGLITTAWQIRGGVRASLLDFAVARQRAALLAEQLSAQTQIVKLLQQRFDAGEISRPDLLTAQIALSKTRLDESDAQTQLANARSQLAEALGVNGAALTGMSLDFNFSARAPGDLTSAEARRVALLGRSDIRGALADYAAAQDDLRLQIAKQYPDLHLGPGYAWNANQNKDNEWSLGLTVDLPILDQNQGPIGEAKARRELAAAQFIALQAKVIGEIDRALAGYRVALDQLQTGEALLVSEQQQEKSVEAQQRAGAADQLDVLSARVEFDTAALGHLDGQAKFQTALGALEGALQRPADGLLAMLNANALTNSVQDPSPVSPAKKNKP
ncbi:MAG TPA: TolC family protein [Candidatus Acidoferrum sp.]|nr:TolC family protein [Candidatus Acidoferrum sp.]